MIRLVPLLLVLAVVLVLYAARRSARRYAAANEIVPGVATRAPRGWAGAHSPEARLHRRLRDAVAALSANRSLDAADLVGIRESLQRVALAVDDRLIAVAALPARHRDQELGQITAAVTAIEDAVAEVVSLRGPSTFDHHAALDAVRTRLDLVLEAHRELDGLTDSSPSLDALRDHLDPDEPDDEPDEGTSRPD